MKNEVKIVGKLNKYNEIIKNFNEGDKKYHRLKFKINLLEHELSEIKGEGENIENRIFILDKEYEIYKTYKKIKKLESVEGNEEEIAVLQKHISDINTYGLKECRQREAIESSKKRRKMILTGPILQTVIAVCFPIALYQLFNSLYTVFDQIVSSSISKTAQGAVSALSQVKNSISAFGAGLAAGGGVLVSRLFGAGEVKKARHASSNLFFMAIVLSLILMLILIPLAVPVMKMCQLSNSKIEIGKNYFRLQLLELFFVSMNNVFIGLEKAKGNSRIVMRLNIMVMIIKVTLTSLFVYAFDLKKIEYVELATIIGQATLTAIGLVVLFAKQNILRLSLKMLRPIKEFSIPILKLSLPIFFGKFVMNLGKVVVNGMCQDYWDVATDELIVGTLGISNNLSGLITSPTNSFEEGQSSIVSQNVGAKNMKRALKIFKKTLLLSTIISLSGYVLIRFILLDQIVHLFTIGNSNSDNESFINMIKAIFKYDSLSIPALGINAAVLGLLYGFGQTKLSFFLNASRIGSRIVFLYSMHKFFPNLSPTRCAGLSMAISNTIILTLSIVFLLLFLYKVKKHSYKGMYFTDPEPEFIELDDKETSGNEILEKEVSQAAEAS